MNPVPLRTLQRRRLLSLAAASLGGAGLESSAATAATPGATTGNTAPPSPAQLVFPRDAGAHPAYKTEWWYITGWANLAGREAAYGFQVTFFRSRVDRTQSMRSRLAARQLLFAHAAISDVQAGQLQHTQRVARWSGEPPGTNPADSASASTLDTGVVLQGWSLLRESGTLRAQLSGDAMAMDLRFASTQPVLLQGAQGLSRKGPDVRHSSYYYSLPHLQASGTLRVQGRTLTLASGSTAWLDHEWSNEMLPAGAVGWDWIGINLFDGSALTAFRLREPGGAALWDGGSFRAGSTLYTFARGEVTFKPVRYWQSPSSRARYPVEWLVRTPADFYTVRAVMDAQELDASASTGSIYWEGLCEVFDSNAKRVGRGYLEMTGYASPLTL